MNINEIKNQLPQYYDALKREQFVETFRLLFATNYGLGGSIAAYCNIYTNSNGMDSFQLMQSGYENVYQLYISAFNTLIHTEDLCQYCSLHDDLVKVCEFLSCLGLGDYHRQGGFQPAIFIRINNPYYLNSLIKSRTYRNDILENIYEKYRYSERIFTYFFTTPMSNEQRWDFIESYFLGESEERLLNFVHS